MLKKTISILSITGIMMLVFLPISANADEGGSLYMDLAMDDGFLEVSIMADSESMPANAVEFGLYFPADKLELISSDTAGSPLCEYLIDNAQDSQNGFYRITCVTSSREVTGINQIVKLTFNVKGAGYGYLQFSEDSQLLAADGYATNILNETIDQVLFIN
jgi:hypothetical protein